MPKKIAIQPAAAVTSAEADDDLMQKLAAKIAVIQEKSGRLRGNPFANAEKFAGKCFFCRKAGHRKSDCYAFKNSSPQNALNTERFYIKSYSISPIGLELPEKDWLAGELSVNSAKGRVLIDTGAEVNITTTAFAEKAGAKKTIGPKIQMTFADGRKSVCHLQAEMDFAMGETKSTATFRILTNLLPGVDTILGKPWLRAAKPKIDFETGSIYINRLHALGPKAETPPTMESSPAAAILTLASLLATAVATAMPATRAGAVTTTTAGGSASLLPEFQQIAEKPPAVVEAKIPTEPPVTVQVSSELKPCTRF